MIDLTQISDEILIARGKYSTVRAAREDALKDMQKKSGEITSLVSLILRLSQDDSSKIDEASTLLISCSELINSFSDNLQNIKYLTITKEELRKSAWSK